MGSKNKAESSAEKKKKKHKHKTKTKTNENPENQPPPPPATGEEQTDDNNIIRVKVETLKKDDGDDRVPPIVGYFPSGFDPHQQKQKPGVKLWRHKNEKRKNRMQLIVSPGGDSPVEFVGKNYEGEGAVPQTCTYALGVLDKDTGTLKIVPIASNKIFRLEPEIKRSDLSDEEPAKEELTAEMKAAKVKELELMYSSKKAINQAKKREALYQSNDPGTQEDLDERIEGIMKNQEAIESAASHNSRNIPPYDLSATTPEMAYPLNKVILAGEWDFLLDIFELLEVGEELAPAAYPSFVRNRAHLLEHIEDDAKKKRLACIFSYITHLVKFKDKHSMDGVSSAKHHKFPSILQQKFSSMFADSNTRRLPQEKINLLIGYVLVLSLIADDFETDISDIAKDLRMSDMILRRHFEELGCKLVRKGTFLKAKLIVPLEFPKITLKRRRK